MARLFLILSLVVVLSFGAYREVLAVLSAPTDTNVISVGEGSARVGWQWTLGGGTIKRFVLSHRIAEATEDWTKNYPPDGILDYTIMGLNENTTYEWTIMAEAENPNNNSSETSGPNFTTLSGGGGDDGDEDRGSPVIVPSDLNPISSETLPELLGNVLNFLFGLAIIILPIVIIYAGILMVTARGDPQKLSLSRTILLWAIVAFAIILLAKGLPTVLRGLL